MKKERTWKDWKDGAVEEGIIDGVDYCVLRGPAEGLNGYACFPSRPVREDGYSGILTYVPVHGGITFATEMDEGRFVYGFDTAHCDSEEYPRDDPQWIVAQIKTMISGIKKAAEVEEKYLLARTNEEKEPAVNAVWGASNDKAKTTNFGVSLKLLSGSL